MTPPPSEAAVVDNGDGSLRLPLPGDLRGHEAALGLGVPVWNAVARPARGGSWTDRLLLVALGGYSLLVALFMVVQGVGLTFDVALIAVALAMLLALRTRAELMDRLPALARDLLPLVMLLLAYELVRGYAAAGVGTVHSTDVLAIERTLFLGHLPAQALQASFHHEGSPDGLAMVATVFYGLHFGLPPAVGVLLWQRRPAHFPEFMAALVVLSLAGFATYLVLPVAPPWYAAETGALLGPGGGPGVEYLKAQGFADLTALGGLDGNGAFQFAIRTLNPDLVGAFPSLHAGYPVLAFLALRRAFGRPAWIILVYAAVVWLSVVYLGDHYVVDVVGGILYACAAVWIVRRPGVRHLFGEGR